MDLFYIIIYTVFIWGISIYIYRKNKFMSLGNLYLFFYSLIFAVSIKLYIEDDHHDFNGLNWYGFLHLIFFLYIFVLPILKTPRKDIKFVETNKTLIKFLYWFTIVFSFIGLYEIYQNFSTGIVLLFTDSAYGNEAYMEIRETMDAALSENRARNFLSVFSGQAHNLSIFLFLYSLIEKNSKSLEKILLGCCVALVFMQAISRGSRFSIVVYSLQFFFFYFYVRNYLPKRVNKFIKILSLSAGVVISAAIIAITASRAENTRRQDSMYLYYDAYISESVLFYNKYAFDPGQIREGERTFPLVKRIMGFENVANGYGERLRKFNKMKIDEVHFITFVGDFMLDYGPIFGSIILLLLASFFRSCIRVKRTLSFPSLCLIFLLILILDGFSLYQLTDTGGNLTFFIFIFLFLISRASISNKQNIIKKNVYQ